MKLDILGTEYEVIDEKPHSSSDGFMGLCNYMEQNIKINVELPFDNRLSTLVHEITHAIADTYGIEMGEEAVNLLAQGWFEVFKSNKILREMFNTYDIKPKPTVGFKSKRARST